MSFFFLLNPKFFDADGIIKHLPGGKWKKRREEEDAIQLEFSGELEEKIGKVQENSRKIAEVIAAPDFNAYQAEYKKEVNRLHAERIEALKKVVEMDEEEAAALLLLLDS
jgi:hypothetical protein